MTTGLVKFTMNPDTVNFDDFLKNKNLQQIMYMVGVNEPEREIIVKMTYEDLFAIRKAFEEVRAIREEWKEQGKQNG